MKTNQRNYHRPFARFIKFGLVIAAVGGFLADRSYGAAATIFADDFESYSGPATALTDVSDADPVNPLFIMSDDNPFVGDAGSGVQVINWMSHSGSQSLLLRGATEMRVNFPDARSGASYTFEFWVYSAREATADRGFRFVLRGEGSDSNGDDFLACRISQASALTSLQYYDGVGPGAAAWVTTTVTNTTAVWQHYRMVMNPNAMTFNLFLDDMSTPVLTGVDLSRSDIFVPTQLSLYHDGNSAEDGYGIFDDISLTVEGSIDLSTTFTEGFESYPARTSPTDDADPQGPWVSSEANGVGSAKARAPVKVQVVGSGEVTPRTGNKCLKLEYGQRAGASLAWGVPPKADVQITWWAKVPAAQSGIDNVILRMSLYGAEQGNTYSGDCALLGYGCRSGNVGDATALDYYTTGWVDSGIDFTPDTWEEYRLTTHNRKGGYTIVKDPNGANPVVIADTKGYVGNSATYGPTFMAAWSSSNGTNHPPVYIDDIEIKSIDPEPTPEPYTPTINGTRFTNSTTVNLPVPIGALAIDPRDNTTILFTVDAGSGGAINKATKVASGNWVVDPVPVVAGLANPSGLTVAQDGTIWWVHDNTPSLMRLKAPWNANTPERVIADFGVLSVTNTVQDDDTFDVCFAPSGFTGSLGAPGQIVVMDRGNDVDANNALFLVDPATTVLNQPIYQNYLVQPTASGLGAVDLVALAALPPNEVVTLNIDGQVSPVDANGSQRTPFWPDFYRDPSIPIAPTALAVDPTTGRIWIADDLTNEVWSCDNNGNSGQRELSFPLIDPAYPAREMDFHDPGMQFSADGKFLVVSDTSTLNGGARLIIFHNESIGVASFKLNNVVRAGNDVQLTWESAGAVTYNVLRANSLSTAGSFVDVSGDITTTSFTDTNSATGAVFYRVVVKP